MKISCQSCGAKYNIADEKVRGKIVKIACKKCGARIEIDGREPEAQAHDQDETRVFDQAAAPGGGGSSADTWTASIDDNDQREVNTQQLIDLIRQGVATADTFVWRDGMADWSAIRDVGELQAYLAASAPMAAPQYSEPPTAAYPSAASPSFSGGGGGGGYGGSVETAQPARLGGSRRGGAVDLFAAPAAGDEDQDVATSAPAGGSLGGMGMGAGMHGDQKPLGARNENSVLFSLSALTASGPSTPATAAPSEDEKSGLIDIQKLAQAAKSNGGSRANDDRAKLDDIMNLGGGGAFGSALGAPILAPPPANSYTESGGGEEKKSNKVLIIGMGTIVALLLVVVIVLLARKPEETAKTDKPALETPKATEKATATAAPTVAALPTETAPDPAAPGGIGKPGTKPTGGAAPAGTGTGKVDPKAGGTTAPTATAAGGKKPCGSLEECMKEKDKGGTAPAPTAAPPAGGGAEFDKGAAKSALSSVPYKDCGTGGAGKVAVTFSPSGSVSSASVSGDFDGGTKSCITGRFKSAKVPAFSGDPKTVGWSISL